MIKIAVAGALGRMGCLAVETLSSNPNEFDYVGGFARHGDATSRIFDDFGTLLDLGPDVVVDFTTHPKTVEIATQCVMRNVAPVIGATGWKKAERDALDALCKKHGVPAMLVPNFAIGAVLMMHFAQQAARFFPSAEIIELHHDQKRDKPSGTAALTAERMKTATGRDVPIQSVRLKGLVAHQEVLLGNKGELLTIRHDSLARESFAAGILLAVRSVRQLPLALTVGLDSLIEQTLQ